MRSVTALRIKNDPKWRSWAGEGTTDYMTVLGRRLQNREEIVAAVGPGPAFRTMGSSAAAAWIKRAAVD